MTNSISENNYLLEYLYGPDNQRIKSVLKQNNNAIKTKYYSFSYEKEITPSGTREIHYINASDGLAAVMIKQNGNETLYFAETDNLGSIIGLLNPNGTYAERFSYDPWGRRRNPTNWSYNNVPTPTLIDRGFTGHEHLDVFGLINMNGRIYDPVLGRFLSVDPVIQSPDYSQSFNGYSYCFNNPMKFFDLTGYSASVPEVTIIPRENWASFLSSVGSRELSDLASIYGNQNFGDFDSYLDFFSKTYGDAGGNGGYLFRAENFGYTYLWLLSQSKGVETCGWITTKGVFVMPTEGYDYSGRNKLFAKHNVSEDRFYECAWEDPNKAWSRSNRYLLFDPRGLGTLEIIGYIHRHYFANVFELDNNKPPDQGITSDGDFKYIKFLRGMPFVLINYDKGIYSMRYNIRTNSREDFTPINNLDFIDVTNRLVGKKLIPIILKYYK